MQHVSLDRRPHRGRPAQPFLEGLSLARARVHELCGPARHTLGLIVARDMTGPVLWLRPAWEGARVHGPGMAGLLDPGRVVFVEADRPADILWTMEEALRSGAVPLVVAELAGPLALTPVRRMQLAAEASGSGPLGLLLSPEGGSSGVESRWHMAPAHRPGAERWRLGLQRSRESAPRDWDMRGEGGAYRLTAAKDGRDA